MIEFLAAAGIGGIIGAFICLSTRAASDWLASRREPDAYDLESAAHWQRMWKHALDTSADHARAHARIADALASKTARIERALGQITPGANATVKRIARILKGDA